MGHEKQVPPAKDGGNIKVLGSLNFPSYADYAAFRLYTAKCIRYLVKSVVLLMPMLVTT